MFKMLRKNRKGFTLIELIVVIAILGILALIAIPRLGGFTQSAKIAADEQLEAQIKNAILLAVSSNEIATPTETSTITVEGLGLTAEKQLVVAGTAVRGDNATFDTVPEIINDKVSTETGFQVNNRTYTFTINKYGEVTVTFVDKK